MNRKLALCCLLSVCGLAASAQAQSLTFQLQRSENFFSLAVDGIAATPPLTGTVANPYYLGRIASIDAGPDSKSWWIGGIAQGGNVNQVWNAAAVKVTFSNLDGGTRSFITLPETRTSVAGPGTSRGVNSVSYDRVNNRVITSADTGFGELRMYDGLAAGSTLTAMTVFDSFNRIMGGAAWDFGPDPVGGNPSIPTHIKSEYPLAAVMTNGIAGPKGVVRSTLDFDSPYDLVNNTNLTGYRYFMGRNSGGFIENTLPNGPKFFPGTYNAGLFGVSSDTTNSFVRDIDVDPSGPLMVSRAHNDLIVAQRLADNTVPDANIARINIPTSTSGLQNQVVGCNVKIMKGTPLGDLVVLNNRLSSAGGQSPFTITQFRKVTAAPMNAATSFPVVPATFKNADGTAATAVATSGALCDYAWLPAEKRLLILDQGNNGTVYVFDLITTPGSITTPPADACGDEGTSVTLTVAAAGDKVSYQWQLGGVDIVGATSTSYTITSLSAATAGTYTVKVFNALNVTPASASCVVSLGPCTPLLSCSPADIAYGDGEPLPPIGQPGGFNPVGPDGGDFDCFFNFYFAAAPDNAVCDIAYGDGEPLPPFGSTGGFNPGVDGGDFDCFFNYYFNGCL